MLGATKKLHKKNYMIQLDLKSLQQKVNRLFGDGGFVSSNTIKVISKDHPLPKFKEAYYDIRFAGNDYKEQISDKIREFDTACLIRDLFIKALAEEFVHIHIREADDPTNEYWILKENELDFSIESLKRLDKKNTYTDFFNRKFCKDEWLPLITGYVLHTILKNTEQHGWNIIYADDIYKIKFKPNAGSKEIVPCDYIKACFNSGFKYIELYNCLQSITAGLSENYSLWRRQYLSNKSEP